MPQPMDPPPLLATKLFVPRTRARAVPRPRLVARLDEALRGSLTLVCAPAGFGKTTLVAEWHASEGGRSMPLAWLSLDKEDGDPARFWAYLVAALQRAKPNLCRELAALLRSPAPPPTAAVLAALVNELAGLTDDLVLALDDYHALATPALHEALASLVDHLPAAVHLAVLTRVDPPWPLARWRARGLVTELRAADLRFSVEEAAALLGQTLGLPLGAEEVATLAARTEGWVAGLQLAALSLQGRTDVPQFVAAFAGTNRYILDFLLEEVLNRESAEVQKFLLLTSPLERLCGALCDALTLGADGQAMLERLERANLFLVPLDEQRRWYRYHHLFADLLQARLRQSRPGELAQLHARAADWYDRQGLADEAVRHAVAAPDYELAADLAMKYWHAVSETGRTATTVKWLEALPTSVVYARPWLSSAYAWILYLNGRLDEVAPYLDASHAAALAMAEGEPTEPRPENPPPRFILTGVAALRSHLARHRGDLAAALVQAEEALALAAGGHPLMQAHAYSAMAHVQRELGHSRAALAATAQAVPLFMAVGNVFAGAVAAYSLCRQYRVAGELARAEEVCTELLRRAEERQLALVPAFGMAHLGLAEIHLERDDLDGAERALGRAMAVARPGGYLEATKNGAILAARLHLTRGEAEAALGVLCEAEAAVGRGASPLLVAEVAAWRAPVLLAQGDLAGAVRWAEAAAARPGDDRGSTRELEALNIVRVWLATGHWAEAARLAQTWQADAAGDGRVAGEVACQALLALARQGLGQEREAMASLGLGLALAATAGYVRLLLDEGPPLVALLRRGLERRAWPQAAEDHARRLLERLPGSAPAPAVAAPMRPSLDLPERPSARELEVLRLLAEGCGNQEIAARLVVSLNTVKKHVANLFGKLGAANRTQAVARARELGLF